MANPLKELFWSATKLYPKTGDGATILMYHSIGSNDGYYTVSERNFNQQLQYLARNGYRVVSLYELYMLLKEGGDVSRTVAITFDDGYKDNYTSALPHLKRYNMPATIFITTDAIGDVIKTKPDTTIPVLNEEEIRELANTKLITLMPHTAKHSRLDRVSHTDARADIEKSRVVIEKYIGATPRIFSYPSGKYTKEIVEYLRKNEWMMGVTTRPGRVTKDTDMLLLPRVTVDSTTTMNKFAGFFGPGLEITAKLGAKKYEKKHG